MFKDFDDEGTPPPTLIRPPELAKEANVDEDVVFACGLKEPLLGGDESMGSGWMSFPPDFESLN